jgi:hypothetical protein
MNASGADARDSILLRRHCVRKMLVSADSWTVGSKVMPRAEQAGFEAQWRPGIHSRGSCAAHSGRDPGLRFAAPAARSTSAVRVEKRSHGCALECHRPTVKCAGICLPRERRGARNVPKPARSCPNVPSGARESAGAERTQLRDAHGWQSMGLVVGSCGASETARTCRRKLTPHPRFLYFPPSKIGTYSRRRKASWQRTTVSPPQ